MVAVGKGKTTTRDRFANEEEVNGGRSNDGVKQVGKHSGLRVSVLPRGARRVGLKSRVLSELAFLVKEVRDLMTGNREIRIMESKSRVLSKLAFLVKEVRDLMTVNRENRITKVHCGQNCVSHFLANKGRCEALTSFWPDNNCNFISHLLDVNSPTE
uniref:Uncharacterized protein n=1 Tax=Oryza punctata TaxID=4537 RepID=A0A0E0KW56_ORYPU